MPATAPFWPFPRELPSQNTRRTALLDPFFSACVPVAPTTVRLARFAEDCGRSAASEVRFAFNAWVTAPVPFSPPFCVRLAAARVLDPPNAPPPSPPTKARASASVGNFLWRAPWKPLTWAAHSSHVL